MTLNVELYQVLTFLIPLLGFGLKFYVDTQKRSVAYQMEINLLRSELNEMKAEIEEMSRTLDRQLEQSRKNSEANLSLLHKIEIELQNKVNR